MHSAKRLCTFFRSVATPFDQKSNSPTIQDLPLEMLVCLFEYLPHSQAVLLRNECRLFRSAVSMSIRDGMRFTCYEVKSKVKSIKARLIDILTDHRIVHRGLLKSLLAWWNLQADLTLLRVMVWRYRNDASVWSPLSSYLGIILEEVKEEIKIILHGEWKPKKKHPRLDKFLKTFTEEIEVHLYRSEMLVPFETRLVELLLSCPCGNIKMTICKNVQGYKRTEVYCDIRNLRNSKETAKPVNVTEGYSRLQNEREILRYLRDYVRKANRAYFRAVVKEIENCGRQMDEETFSAFAERVVSFITDGDEPSFEHTQNIANGEVQEIYECYSTMNVCKSGLSCSFEFQHHEKKNQSFDKEVGRNCAACGHKSANNAFTLRITSERNRTNFIKEVLVVFEPEEENYELSILKHYLT